MPHRVFIVTGIPGTGVSESLRKIQRRIPDLRIFSLERDYLCGLAAPHLGGQGALRDNHIMHVLNLPQELLENLWRESIRQIAEQIATLRDGTTAIVTLHASYYNLLKKGYVSLIDFKVFREAFGQSDAVPSGVLTFIDDIFDCQQRICSARPRRLFDPPDTLQESLVQLFRILDWRHQEILLSRLIASQCEQPTCHVVFAIKQPIATLRKILLAESTGVYFSHPISEVRRLEAAGDDANVRHFLEEYDNHVSLLQEHYIVYEPTAIDEYRFEGFPELPLPKLTSRWPLAAERNPRHDDVVWTSTTDCGSAYAFPAGWQPDTREIPAGEVPHCSSLMSELVDLIDSQTTTRDYQLIDQSKLTYAFWPLFNGNASGGVEKELKYACLCRDVDLQKELVICCRASDRELYRTRVVWEGMLKKWRQSNTIVGDSGQFERLKTRLHARENNVRGMIDGNDIGGLANLLREAIEECRMHFAAEENLRPMDPHPMEVRQAQAERCAQNAIEVAQTPPYFEGLEARIFAEPPQFPLAFV